MSVIRRRHKQRAKAFLGAACLALAMVMALPVWARYLAVLPVAAAVLVVPVLVRGSRSAVTFSTRQARIEARRPYTDPRTGQLVRPPRPPVPSWLRGVVYAADRYRCVYCHRGPRRRGAKWAKIQLDHIQPYALGFNVTLLNSATLCQQHNLVKSSYWKSDSGKIYYRPFAHASAMGEAGKIARTEMRVRLYPWRIARMAIAYWLRKGK
jgi:5-methylcytosine-specific restriction endonuclease McrA